MRKYILLIVFVRLLVSCNNDDDATGSIDMDLLTGQWLSTNSCPDQNNIVFNLDGSYVHTRSGNPCDNNDNDTVRASGTFTLNGDQISFNEQSSVVIEEGDVVSIPVGDFNTLVSQRITVLTATELLIERQFSTEPFFRNWSFVRE